MKANTRGFFLVLMLIFIAIGAALLTGLSKTVAVQQQKIKKDDNAARLKNDIQEILLDRPEYWLRPETASELNAAILRDEGYLIPRDYLLCSGPAQKTPEAVTFTADGTTLTIDRINYRNFYLRPRLEGVHCSAFSPQADRAEEIEGLKLQYTGISRMLEEMHRVAFEIRTLQQIAKTRPAPLSLSVAVREHERRYNISAAAAYGNGNEYSLITDPPNYYDGCMFCGNEEDCKTIADRVHFPCIDAKTPHRTDGDFRSLRKIPIFSNKKYSTVWGEDVLKFSNKEKTCNDYPAGKISGCLILRAVGPLSLTVDVVIPG